MSARVTSEFTVPDEAVGAIIGHSGSKISEIRAISGASIHITRAEAHATVLLQGTEESIQLAKSLCLHAVSHYEASCRLHRPMAPEEPREDSCAEYYVLAVYSKVLQRIALNRS